MSGNGIGDGERSIRFFGVGCDVLDIAIAVVIGLHIIAERVGHAGHPVQFVVGVAAEMSTEASRYHEHLPNTLEKPPSLKRNLLSPLWG